VKKNLYATVLIIMMLALSGCGGGGSSGDGGSSPPPLFETRILSNPAYDGDIRFDLPNQFSIVQGNPSSVLAGIDPVTGSEYRAFLAFPLTGSGGVPGSAIINSATLDIFITSISIQPAAASIPIRIELVAFQPPTLLASDYDRIVQPALAVKTFPIFRADVLQHVTINVTSLMEEAQRRGLINFQVRILEDDGFVFPGLIEIDDTTNKRAPLLTVSYF
jgi:hypothetical protein